jgi:uncharacterized membrane protein YjfL (UPF0719 family)
MAKIIRKEIRKRSTMGKIVKWTFIAFNILMLVWFVAGMGAVGDVAGRAVSDAEQAGAAIGTTLAAGMLLTLWAIGDVILGILVLLTRGQKTIIDETVED